MTFDFHLELARGEWSLADEAQLNALPEETQALVARALRFRDRTRVIEDVEGGATTLAGAYAEGWREAMYTIERGINTQPWRNPYRLSEPAHPRRIR